jgi:hypothetical protein
VDQLQRVGRILTREQFLRGSKPPERAPVSRTGFTLDASHVARIVTGVTLRYKRRLVWSASHIGAAN